jgi:hypothetical protein
MNECEGVRRVSYGSECATFVPVCCECGRFVKSDKCIEINEVTGISNDFNATCARCGRTHMIFEGFV